ncbi:lipase maturation factor 2 isoform X1 [Bubalus kerabau]|uniref:lipase maturation factor 2 isoform X1 n=1 Tax=Bubalus carabanensis TaxID=3119969 RepID=UPI00244E8022|nr:lipase maturation factor 2 isoform X1 [Bubalus carabanensis]
MAGSRLPRQLFLQGVAAVFMFAFASLYTQIPGLYGPEGILPARRTLRPQGKGRWQQLWETPTLLWEAPLLGLDTAQGLELLSLLGTVLALGALLTRQLRHPLVYLLLWAAYLSVCQVGQVFLYFQWDSLLLETGFLAVLVAPLGLPPNHKQTPQGRPGGVSPHEGLPFWLVRWLLFRLMFASGVVKLTSRCPAWWGLTALTYHYETQCLPTPAAWFAHHLPVWLHKLSVVATFLIEIAVPPLFFAPVRRLRLAAFYSQVLLQVLIIITGNYNFFNLLTLVLTTALLDDTHLAAKSSTSRRKRTPSSWPKALLAMLTLLLELAVYGLLAYGVVHYFGLEVDWEQHVVHSRTTFTFHQLSQWLKMVTLPTMWLGAASLAWELLTALWRWVQVRGSLRKLYAAVQLSVFGTATVALFLISLVPYSYMEPSSHGRLWTGAHRLFGTVEHLQLANSYGLFRRMTGLGDRVHVQTREPEPAAPHRGAPPAAPRLADVVRGPGPPHAQSLVHQPGAPPPAGQGACDPPRPEPRAQLPLPPAAAHVRAGPALQVLVLAPLGAGPMVATPVGGRILPIRVPGGPGAGHAAQAVWPSGQKPAPGPWLQQHPEPGSPLGTETAVSPGGPRPALGAPGGCGGHQGHAGPAGPAVPASDQGGEAQASPPGGLGSRQQASFPSPQHQQRLPDPPAEKVAVICQPHVLRGSGSRLPLALCHRRAQPPCLSQLPRRRRSGCWPVGGASPSASRASPHPHHVRSQDTLWPARRPRRPMCDLAIGDPCSLPPRQGSESEP